MLEYFRETDELEAGTGSRPTAEVVDVPQASRYELRLDGRLIGLAAYRRRNGRIAFTHTEVDEACEGRGFGSRLAAAALEDARRQGLEVVPLCPFIAHYIEWHGLSSTSSSPPTTVIVRRNLGPSAGPSAVARG